MTSIPALSITVLAALLASAPAWAQFKVVSPDGKVTYTDRQPVDAAGRIVPLGRTARAADTAAALPAELRQVAARFPVTLYTSPDCAPCESGRRLLQRRGIPAQERQVLNDDDGAALERLTGGRTVPALAIGAQVLRGYLESDWQSYLDIAGYPRASRLPQDWPTPAALPLTERQSAEPARRAPQAPPTPVPALPDIPASGIRF